MIKDCTFILPDDFDGTAAEAFSKFLEYHTRHVKDAITVDDSNIFSTFDILLHSDSTSKVCGLYGIYELIDGRYQIVDAEK